MENIHSTKKVDGIQPEKHQNIQDVKHDTKAVLAHTHHLFRRIAKNVDEASSKKSKEKQMEDSIATLRNLAKTADPENQYKLQDKINEIHQRDALVLAGKKIPTELKKKLDDMPQRVAEDMKMPGLATLLGNLVGIMGSNRILMMQNLDISTNFTSGQLQQTCQELTDACTKIAQSVQEQQAAKEEADKMKAMMGILSIVLAFVSVVVAAVTMGAAAALIAVAATIVNMVPVTKDGKTCADLLSECPGMDHTKAAGVLCALEVICTLGAGAASGGLSAASTAASAATEAGVEGGIEMMEVGARAAIHDAAEAVPEVASGAVGGAGRAAAEAAEEGVFATIKNAFSKTLSAAKSLKDQVSGAIDKFFEPFGEAINKQLAKVGMKADFSQLGSALKLGISTGLAYNNPFGLIATDATKARLLKEFHDEHGRDPNAAEMSNIQSAADNVGLTVGICTSIAAVGFAASAASSGLESASTSSNQFVRRFQEFRQYLLESGIFKTVAGVVEASATGASGGISIAQGVADKQFAVLTRVVGQGERKALGLRSAKEILENMQSFIQSQDSASIDMQSKQIQGLVDSAKNFFKT